MKPISIKEFVPEWIKDLRSGKFQQCQSELWREGKHCCLGVAVETAHRLGLVDDEERKGRLRITQNPEKNYNYGVCPEIFGQANPFLEKTGTSCWQMNDSRKNSFAEIADALEKEYLS